MGVQERKAREAAARRAAIVAVATDLFRQTDWEAVTVEEIAQRAEIGKGTVYQHFSSKDELLAAMFVAHDVALGEALAGLRPSKDVVQDLSRALRLVWEHDLEDPALHLKALSYVGRRGFADRIGKSTRAALDAAQRRVRDWFLELIRRAMDEGAIRRDDADDMVFFGEAVVDGAHRAALLAWSRGDSPESELTSFFEARFRYLRAALLRAWGCPEDRIPSDPDN